AHRGRVMRKMKAGSFAELVNMAASLCLTGGHLDLVAPYQTTPINRQKSWSNRDPIRMFLQYYRFSEAGPPPQHRRMTAIDRDASRNSDLVLKSAHQGRRASEVARSRLPLR